MNASYLAKFNPEQRRAAEYGGPSYAEAGALLIVAGAGSGKTNTLAHRVAHLIVNGADPRRIMLLTFSRRAAAEMMRRVERAFTIHDREDSADLMNLVRHDSAARVLDRVRSSPMASAYSRRRRAPTA